MYSDLPVMRQRERNRRRRSDSDDERCWPRGQSRSRSRERDRGRDRNRDRRRGRDRDRDHSRYYDRSRSRSSSYSRSRSRERDRDYYRERYRRDDRNRSRDREYRDRKKPDSDYPLEVTSIIMIRNLKPVVKKEDISKAVGASMSYVKDLRLVQKKDGISGFAFLEFYEVSDAMSWMNQNSSSFCVLGEQVSVEYCRQRKGWEQKEGRKEFDGDWTCFKCATLNFSRRRMCMTCDCPRTESDSLHEDVREGRLPQAETRRVDGDKEENETSPTNILIFRGLDALTREDAVQKAIQGVSDLTVRDIRLIKDKATNISRGFCFVELETIEDATALLKTVQNQYPALFIDGRRVSASYARQSATPKTSTSGVASAAIAQAQWSMSATGASNPLQPQAGNSEKKKPMQQAYQQAAKSDTSQSSSSEYPSTYSYDETSGMYYDSATGLYYDPNTQYHYNSETGLYCYYDTAQQKYISVDQDGNPLPSSAPTNSTKSTKAKKADVASSKSLNAKKIAKDMERWAKTVNAAKSVQQQQLQAVIEQERNEAVSSVATSLAYSDPTPSLSAITRTGVPLASAMQKTDEKPSLTSHTMEAMEAVSTAHRIPVGADSNPNHTDWDQLACLLCKRKFTSKEMLVKHQQFSDLHKQNLQKSTQTKSLLAVSAGETDEIKYRDRAKERRQKFGTPAVIPGWKKRLERELVKEQSTPYEEPTREGIKDDNVGNRMLQAMGWSEGEGLGLAKQGIVEPIQAERRTASAGLGSAGSKYASLYSSAGSYRDTLKQLTKARFDEAFK